MLTRGWRRRLAAGLLAAAGAVCRAHAAGQSGVQQPPTLPAPTLPATQIDDRQRAADLDAPRRVSLSFGEPVPLRDVLLLLVRDTPFSLALDPEVTGTFIGELKQVTLRQAIEAVIGTRPLDYDTRGTLLHVFAKRTETRLFDVDFLAVQRAWRRALAAPDGTALNASAGATDPFDDLEKGITSLLSPSGSAYVDRRAGVAQVTDFAETLDRVALYVEALHGRASGQVRVQARVLDVALRDAGAIDWSAVRKALGLPAGSRSSGLTVSDASTLQAALSAQGDVRIVGSAEVTALNGEPAVMHVGTPDVSSLALSVIAQIAADGVIQVSASPSWSERAAGQKSVKGVPAMEVAEGDSASRVLDGDTIVLAGWLRPGERSRTATGFAALFGAPSRPVAINRELVVLITPTVVTPGGRMPRAGRRQ